MVPGLAANPPRNPGPLVPTVASLSLSLLALALGLALALALALAFALTLALALALALAFLALALALTGAVSAPRQEKGEKIEIGRDPASRRGRERGRKTLHQYRFAFGFLAPRPEDALNPKP